MKIGVIGSGSWGTAQVKILTDNGHRVNWAVRNERVREQLLRRRHNPQYLSSVHFDTTLLEVSVGPEIVLHSCDLIVVAVPSSYMTDVFSSTDALALKEKQIVSAVKGMVPGEHLLLNEYLERRFSFPLSQYVTIMGPCHAEEVAGEKLSYLTFSGIDTALATKVAAIYENAYINTVVNNDIFGVQYAAIMKNIYALGAGIAHGLEYGDNFQSVFIANCARELSDFLEQVGNWRKGKDLEHAWGEEVRPDYMASVYLGDLLVTSYSLFSRNRTFGNMLGKGYSVQAAQLELNMIAEGYPASKAIRHLSETVGASLPIAGTIYSILWDQLCPAEGFRQIENELK